MSSIDDLFWRNDTMKGGPGSGYHSEPGDPHRGRPGQRGGSLPRDGEGGEESPPKEAGRDWTDSHFRRPDTDGVMVGNERRSEARTGAADLVARMSQGNIFSPIPEGDRRLTPDEVYDAIFLNDDEIRQALADEDITVALTRHIDTLNKAAWADSYIYDEAVETFVRHLPPSHSILASLSGMIESGYLTPEMGIAYMDEHANVAETGGGLSFFKERAADGTARFSEVWSHKLGKMLAGRTRISDPVERFSLSRLSPEKYPALAALIDHPLLDPSTVFTDGFMANVYNNMSVEDSIQFLSEEVAQYKWLENSETGFVDAVPFARRVLEVDGDGNFTALTDGVSQFMDFAKDQSLMGGMFDLRSATMDEIVVLASASENPNAMEALRQEFMRIGYEPRARSMELAIERLREQQRADNNDGSESDDGEEHSDDYDEEMEEDSRRWADSTLLETTVRASLDHMLPEQFGYTAEARLDDDGNPEVAGTLDAYSEQRGTTVEAGEFAISVIADENTVYFGLLSMAEEFQGSGVAVPFLRTAIDLAEENGMATVSLNADITIGIYAWAKFGFDGKSGEVYKAQMKFEKWLKAKAEAHPELADVVLPQFEKMQQVANFTIPGVSLKGSDIYNRDVPPSADLHLGKAFLLDLRNFDDLTPNGEGGMGDWDAEIDIADLRTILDEIEAKQAAKSVKGGPGSGYFDPHYGRPGKRGGSTERDEGNEVYEGKVRERAQENAGWWADQMAGLAEPPAPPTPLVNQMAGLAEPPAPPKPENAGGSLPRNENGFTVDDDGNVVDPFDRDALPPSIPTDWAAVTAWASELNEGMSYADAMFEGTEGDEWYLDIGGNGEDVVDFHVGVLFVGDDIPADVAENYRGILDADLRPLAENEMNVTAQIVGAEGNYLLQGVIEIWPPGGDRTVPIGKFQMQYEPSFNAVEFSELNIHPDQHGKGAAETFLRLALDVAKYHGAREVTLLADITIGRYAWAKFGFEANSATIDKVNRSFQLWMRERVAPTNPAVYSTIWPTFTSMKQVAEYTIPGVSLKGSDIFNEAVAPDATMHIGKAFLLDEPDSGGLGDWDGKISTDALAGILDKIAAKAATKAFSVKGGPGSGYHSEPGDPHRGRPGQRGGSLPRDGEGGEESPKPDENILTPEAVEEALNSPDLSVSAMDRFLYAADKVGMSVADYDALLFGQVNESVGNKTQRAAQASLRYAAMQMVKQYNAGEITAQDATLLSKQWLSLMPYNEAVRRERVSFFANTFERQFYERFFSDKPLPEIADAMRTLAHARRGPLEGESIYLADNFTTEPFLRSAREFVKEHKLAKATIDSHDRVRAILNSEFDEKKLPLPITMSIIEAMGVNADPAIMSSIGFHTPPDSALLQGVGKRYVWMGNNFDSAAKVVAKATMNSSLRDYATRASANELLGGLFNPYLKTSSHGLKVGLGVWAATLKEAKTLDEAVTVAIAADELVGSVTPESTMRFYRYDEKAFPVSAAAKDQIENTLISQVEAGRYSMAELRSALLGTRAYLSVTNIARSTYWNTRLLQKALDADLAVTKDDVAFAMLHDTNNGDPYIPGDGAAPGVDKIGATLTLKEFNNAVSKHVNGLRDSSKPLSDSQIVALVKASPRITTDAEFEEINGLMSDHSAAWPGRADNIMTLGNAGHLGTGGYALTMDSMKDGDSYAVLPGMKKEWFDTSTLDYARLIKDTHPTYFPAWMIVGHLNALPEAELDQEVDAVAMYEWLVEEKALPDLTGGRQGALEAIVAKEQDKKYPVHESIHALTGERITLDDPAFRAFRTKSVGSDVSAAGEAKNDVVGNLSVAAGLTYDEANGFIQQWAISSNGSDMRSMGIQQSAVEEFSEIGLSLSEWQKSTMKYAMEDRDRSHMQLEDPDVEDDKERRQRATVRQRKALRAMYERTQAMLAEEGVKYLRVYRGISLNDTTDADTGRLVKVGEPVSFDDNALASWSLTPAIARRFGHFVISAVIPASNILSTPRTGFGCLGEHEVVVMGTNGNMRGRVERLFQKYAPELESVMTANY